MVMFKWTKKKKRIQEYQRDWLEWKWERTRKEEDKKERLERMRKENWERENEEFWEEKAYWRKKYNGKEKTTVNIFEKYLKGL